jgi:hypothetical protein
MKYQVLVVAEVEEEPGARGIFSDCLIWAMRDTLI